LIIFSLLDPRFRGGERHNFQLSGTLPT
jgi:hypothetical protein